jgi:hypothetical protein
MANDLLKKQLLMAPVPRSPTGANNGYLAAPEIALPKLDVKTVPKLDVKTLALQARYRELGGGPATEVTIRQSGGAHLVFRLGGKGSNQVFDAQDRILDNKQVRNLTTTLAKAGAAGGGKKAWGPGAADVYRDVLERLAETLGKPVDELLKVRSR